MLFVITIKTLVSCIFVFTTDVLVYCVPLRCWYLVVCIYQGDVGKLYLLFTSEVFVCCICFLLLRCLYLVLCIYYCVIGILTFVFNIEM